MSPSLKETEECRHEEAGRLIAERLRKAREKTGQVCCPVCHITFDATSVLKCPGCRTFIDQAFRNIGFHKKTVPKSRSRLRKKTKKREIPQTLQKLPLQLSLFP